MTIERVRRSQLLEITVWALGRVFRILEAVRGRSKNEASSGQVQVVQAVWDAQTGDWKPATDILREVGEQLDQISVRRTGTLSNEGLALQTVSKLIREKGETNYFDFQKDLAEFNCLRDEVERH